MEEYAKDNGREMVLNKYADCTEEEYRALTETSGEYFLLVRLWQCVYVWCWRGCAKSLMA